MNSDTIQLPKTNEEKISYIVKTMKKSVFAGLDRCKEEAKKKVANSHYSFGYDDLKFDCYISRDLSECLYRYNYQRWGYDIYCRPFSAYSYESGSAERKLVETLCNECRDETIAKAVMTRLLNEWKQKEERARRQKRIERRAKHISARLDETKEVAKKCGISVDTVLAIELKDALYALSKEKQTFSKHVDYNADDWEDWDE